MKALLKYEDLSTAQKLRSFWDAFCDADPCPPEFPDEMESAGFISLVPVTADDLEAPFAAERGIEPGGMLWQLTEAGRAALSKED